ncbi:MAG: 1-deoxy-D-xylulose-5-phosphate reductoisomerase [Bacilli bacterium]|nr:1-deoxy-D-xylulose-5-phosphate reductoisomerase [Bacilli bacterium]MDD3389481.1 1-deoxy-D-xylulose-5-phosphate reductoisomerase [Bacilli bacterium]MDD4344318.1 1-deoxy-D-xylulose-5-phosphate reductoisomerase [Bacilli bacterium]MDD4520948.1 1-deoxy-D-xylulose-5-phosphate reductoisomerase [Bacilli bacterium]HKM10988.1 1-deoxy-D-xylulose-5-phosphate reductoisomerase [Bacilli bacterium]
MEQVLLLGASGSIGEQTLSIIKEAPNDFVLVGFSVGQQSNKIEPILSAHPMVKYVFLRDKELADALSNKYPNIKFFSGDSGIIALTETCDFTMLVNALVGFVGLGPTLVALGKKATVALANKEALVVGGALIKELLHTGNGQLYPIDSEHVALRKCLAHANLNQIERVVITASGGPFRNWSSVEMQNATVADALKHPSWQMGAKITIDSATMMNKGFEVIEAHYLFDIPLSQIDVLIHPESKIHALVEFRDGSYLADVGPTSMAIPIAHALYRGKRPLTLKHPRLPLEAFNTWHFYPLEKEQFPAVEIAKNALEKGGIYPTILNAANEEAVHAFLNGQIHFNEIVSLVADALKHAPLIDNLDYPTIVRVDELTRQKIRKKIGI